MSPPSAFQRRAWEKYPVYFTDEEHDNLDDDPRERRNTSKTLAEELAICEQKESAANFRQKLNRPPVDPEKRIKARIGKRFLQKGTGAAVGCHGSDSPGGLGKANTGTQQNGTSSGSLQSCSGALGTDSRV
ncbi:hypothetical protein PHISP_05215 [Aspergillus sp. HF37]|nr:hypothetical protein PHISP_05215 [Aspergillus sp. HF37]